MATYKFTKYKTWDGYEYFAICKKSFWGGWKEVKTFGLSYLGTHSKEHENNQKQNMMEAVDRLVKASHTVI